MSHSSESSFSSPSSSSAQSSSSSTYSSSHSDESISSSSIYLTVTAIAPYESTFENTFNYTTINCDPPEYYPLVQMIVNGQGLNALTFDQGQLQLDLTTSPQDVQCYGYNVFNAGDLGDIGTAKIQWRIKPDGTPNDLVDFDVYRLSNLIKKPVNDDKNTLQGWLSSGLFSAIKPNIPIWYNYLIDNYPPGSPEYDIGISAKDTFENGTGYVEIKANGTDPFALELLDWFSGGWFSADTANLDTTNLTNLGAARGVSPSQMGSPLSIDYQISLRPNNAGGYMAFFSDPNNVNLAVQKLGFQVKYQPDSGTQMVFGTGLQNPIELGVNKFTFNQPRVYLTTSIQIRNFPVLPDPNIFKASVSWLYTPSSGRFDVPAASVSINYSLP